MAGPTRLELATSGVTGRRSNQLNYDPAWSWLSCFRGHYIKKYYLGAKGSSNSSRYSGISIFEVITFSSFPFSTSWTSGSP